MTPQSSIAHYRITSKLGEGGMGAVYRATDTKLHRDVAVKVLPDSFAQDPDRMVRFEREAQVLASLNHPNIAAIYGVEDRALVMELVEGPTLAGPMPVEQALPIVHQLVDALEYAHEKGVVHRDLKPANIKVTPEGRVKVLDFGLAKAMSAETGAADPVNSPTLTMRATVVGMIMGTAAYMAPEQARGHSVDKRADIWSFGVVVYELVTGKQLFDGQSISDTLASVLKETPNFELVPPQLRRLLRACLVRDPKLRMRDIGDARLLIEEETPRAEGAPIPQPPAPNPYPWIAAALTLALAIVGALWWRASRPVSRPLARLSVDLGPEAVLGIRATAAISPDGTRIVFPARGADGRQMLATRLLDQVKPVFLPGTENGFDPFFSPDGQGIGFFTVGKMKKTAAQGGAPITLCDVSEPRGGSWGEDGTIIVAPTSSGVLFRVPDSGGTPQPVTKFAGSTDLTHRWPQILPGGEAILYTASDTTGSFDDARIEVVILKTGEKKTLVRGGHYGRYLPSGHLLYVHQGTLFEVPLDAAHWETRGVPAPVLEDVAGSPTYGSSQYDFSQTGVFVYLSGKALGQTLMWMDSAGKLQPILSTAAAYITPRLSPDGKRLAFNGGPTEPRDLWVDDWQRDTLSRLTFSGTTNRYPLWTPDGKHIAFASVSKPAIWWIRSDGGGQPQILLDRGTGLVVPYSFSPDGRVLAFSELSQETGYDIWTMPLDLHDPEHPVPGNPEIFLRTPSNERLPAISPDGRWMAYASNETGTYEVFVRPFRTSASSGAGKWQVSTAGGNFPVWSRDGRELFFENAQGQILVVTSASRGDSFDSGKPRLWSPRPLHATSNLFPNMDISPDGKRFVVTMSEDLTSDTKSSIHVMFLLNFFDEMKRRTGK